MRYDEFAILGSRSSFFPCHPMLRACDSCHKWPSTAKAVTSQVNLKNISEYVPTVPTAQTIGSDVGICQWLVAIVWMLLKIIDIHWWVSGYPMDPPCYTKVSMLQTTAEYSSYLSWQLHGMMWNVSPRMSTSSCAPHPGRCHGGSLCAPVIDAYGKECTDQHWWDPKQLPYHHTSSAFFQHCLHLSGHNSQ